jgi:hypothetical protein
MLTGKIIGPGVVDLAGEYRPVAETGFLIDPALLMRSLLDNGLLVIGIIFALVASKFIAAYVAGLAFGYSPIHRLMMHANDIKTERKKSDMSRTLAFQPGASR